MTQDKVELAAKQGGDPPVAFRVADALDTVRLDEIGRLADLASSYWRSISLAADRGDAVTVAVHCRQAARVAREVFALAGELTNANPISIGK